MVVTGRVCVRGAGVVLVPAGAGDCVVHAETEIITMQMTRSRITFRFIENPRLLDLINKTLTARILESIATARPGRISIRGIWFPADWITKKFL